MAERPEDLQRLVGLAGLKRDRLGQKLGSLRRRIAWLRREIAHVRNTSQSVEPDRYARAGRDEVRELWRSHRLSRLNAELAGCLADEEGLRRQTARAAARADVLAELSGPSAPRR